MKPRNNIRVLHLDQLAIARREAQLKREIDDQTDRLLEYVAKGMVWLGIGLCLVVAGMLWCQWG